MSTDEKSNCEISGAESILIYDLIFVLSTGLFCLLTYTLALIYKLVHISASLLIPITLHRMKLRWHRIPTSNYDHYKGEFDFEVDDVLLDVDYCETANILE